MVTQEKVERSEELCGDRSELPQAWLRAGQIGARNAFLPQEHPDAGGVQLAGAGMGPSGATAPTSLP